MLHEGLKFHERVESVASLNNFVEMEIIMPIPYNVLTVFSVLFKKETLVFLESESYLLPLWTEFIAYF